MRDTYPVLFLSSRLGANERMYAHVQMSNRMTVRRLWKLKMADYKKNRVMMHYLIKHILAQLNSHSHSQSKTHHTEYT